MRTVQRGDAMPHQPDRGLLANRLWRHPLSDLANLARTARETVDARALAQIPDEIDMRVGARTG